MPYLVREGGLREFGSAEQLAGLYEALAKAQSAFGPIHRTRDVKIRSQSGSEYSFAYAPLEDLLEATRPALGANALSVLTPLANTADGRAEVLVMIAHGMGGRIMCGFEFAPLAEMKALGGQITYLRRYGYSAMLNLAADADADDMPDDATAQPKSAGVDFGAMSRQLAQEKPAEKMADVAPPVARPEGPSNDDVAPPLCDCGKVRVRRSAASTATKKAWSGWFCQVKSETGDGFMCKPIFDAD